MRFSKISITTKGVTLVRETKDSNTGATEAIELSSPERPKTTFDDAVQAFDPYVRALLDGAIDLTDAAMSITTLNLSDDKNGNRGLIVTAIIPVPKAYDKPLVFNTPLVRQGDLMTDAEEAMVLSPEVMELIALVEGEATKYANGERMAPEMAAQKKKEKSANADAADERMAEAEVASTRKPKPTAVKGQTPLTLQ